MLATGYPPLSILCCSRQGNMLACSYSNGFTAVTAVETVIEIQETTWHFKQAPHGTTAQCSCVTGLQV